MSYQINAQDKKSFSEKAMITVVRMPVTILRRNEKKNNDPSAVPHIVHEVLQSPGQPLDPSTRMLMESRFGHDFSQVRVHTDVKAAESAKAVNALAYTVGRDIVFGQGQYIPHNVEGCRLLAHELPHVVQQGGRATVLDAHAIVSPSDMPYEQEAYQAADRYFLAGKTFSPFLTPVLTGPLLQRDELTSQESRQKKPTKATMTTLPGFSQKGDTCGASSLVTALLIWDREKRDPKAPNTMVTTVCNIILTYLAQYRSQVIKGWNAKGLDGEELYDIAHSSITSMRDSTRRPGLRVTETEYQELGAVLYLLYVDEGRGLSAAAIWNLQWHLGLESGKAESADSFERIMNNSLLKNLRPGQIAQIGWYVKRGKPNTKGEVSLGHHAFLIGRLKDGRWFLSDQGPIPAFEMVASDLNVLKTNVTVASNAGSYWLYTGSIQELKFFAVGGWTGVRLLSGPSGVEKKAAGIVPPGTFLAEVDAGLFTIGDRIISGDFISRYYDFSEAERVYTADYGGLIVEMPAGVFSYYRTNLVRDANLTVSDIDKDDSTGGLLMRREFFHAWLRLCSRNACRAKLLQVY